MKPSQITIIFLFFNIMLSAQPNADSIGVMFVKQSSTYLITYKDFVFASSSLGMREIYTIDSTVFYDGFTNHLSLRKASKNSGFDIKLDKDTVLIESYKTGKLYKFNQDIDSNLGVHRTRQINIEGTTVILYYVNKRIKVISFYYLNNRNFNIVLNRSAEKNNLCWDLIIEDKNSAKINLICNAPKNRIGSVLIKKQDFVGFADYEKSSPGIEIINNNAESNSLDKIRVVSNSKFAGVLAYNDLINFDKNGKIKRSFFKIKYE